MSKGTYYNTIVSWMCLWMLLRLLFLNMYQVYVDTCIWSCHFLIIVSSWLCSVEQVTNVVLYSNDKYVKSVAKEETEWVFVSLVSGERSELPVICWSCIVHEVLIHIPGIRFPLVPHWRRSTLCTLCWRTTRTAEESLWMDDWNMKTPTWLHPACRCHGSLWRCGTEGPRRSSECCLSVSVWSRRSWKRSRGCWFPTRWYWRW